MSNYLKTDVLSYLQGKTYPGRTIICGLTEDGKYLVNGYFIMGRSENSRNRIFLKEDENLMIKPFDESKVEDPSLIIYYPMRVLGNNIIVTNGDQTDTIYDFIESGKGFEAALNTREFEPDFPNFTPRISSISTIEEGMVSYELSILKSNDESGTSCNRFYFSYRGKAGLGHVIHTYKDDGNPLPSFEGEPVRIGISSDINSFSDSIWNCLNEENKISLYLRYTDVKTMEYDEVIINKLEL